MLANITTVNQIKAIDCEISIYRKGCVSIHVDMINQVVTWRESKQWCNNFTRTISSEAVSDLMRFISASPLLGEILSPQADPEPFLCENCEYRTDSYFSSEKPNDHDMSKIESAASDNSATEKNCLISCAEKPRKKDQHHDEIDWYQHVDASKSCWQIVMTSDQGSFYKRGHFPLPKGWIEFQRVIERVSQAPFRLF